MLVPVELEYGYTVWPRIVAWIEQRSWLALEVFTRLQ